MSMSRYQKELVNKMIVENDLLRAQLTMMIKYYSQIREPEVDPTVPTLLLLAEINLTEKGASQ